MSFKESPAHFQMLDVALIDADPTQPRQHIDAGTLTGLANSIRMKGLIHPLVVHAADAGGRHTLIVGERRWRAAMLAGEKTVPALIRACAPGEALEIQLFENLGQGLRVALDARDMANAVQAIAERFTTRDAAAEHFGRNAAWLEQATAAAKLSPKVSALLDAGRISSTGAAVRLEKLAQKNEGKADSLIGQIEGMPEGQKLSRKAVDSALADAGGRRRKKEETPAGAPTADQAAATGAVQAGHVPPWEEAPPTSSPDRRRVNPGKVERVARILGLSGSDEEEILVQLIDAFLALQDERPLAS